MHKIHAIMPNTAGWRKVEAEIAEDGKLVLCVTTIIGFALLRGKVEPLVYDPEVHDFVVPSDSASGNDGILGFEPPEASEAYIEAAYANDLKDLQAKHDQRSDPAAGPPGAPQQGGPSMPARS